MILQLLEFLAEKAVVGQSSSVASRSPVYLILS